MAQEDPFASFDPSATIIMPRPGGRPARPAAEATVQHGEPISEAAVASGLNLLVAAANPLVNLVPQLRSTLQHPDPAGLREQLANQVRTFETRARALGIAQETIIAARYVLCTFLDETAASTPWGGSGLWSKNSLLVTFHNEAWGGEKFFLLMNKLAENPSKNRDLLELMYACLSLGFEGRYRIIEGGKVQLDSLRERLALLLRQQTGEYERALSPRWQGVPTKRHPVLGLMPLWVFSALAGVLLLLLFLTLSYRLNQASDPVFTQILALRAPPIQVPAPAPVKPRLAGLLAPEIAAGLLEVHDEADRSTVILRGSNMFALGSANLSEQYRGLIVRIGEALAQIPGAVVVTGHTDNIPSRTVQYPSNWHLSRARADSVLLMLANSMGSPGRLSAEGRGDADPVAPNDTQENRARNRRVEVTVFDAGAGAALR